MTPGKWEWFRILSRISDCIIHTNKEHTWSLCILRVRATSINFICKHLFVCKSGERVNLKLLRETPTESTYIRIFILVEWVKQRIHWITVHYGVAGTTPRYRVAFCVVKSLEHRKCGGMWDWLPPINLTEAHENKAQKKQLHCSFIYSFYFSLKLTLKTWRKQRRWQTNFFLTVLLDCLTATKTKSPSRSNYGWIACITIQQHTNTQQITH